MNRTATFSPWDIMLFPNFTAVGGKFCIRIAFIVLIGVTNLFFASASAEQLGGSCAACPPCCLFGDSIRNTSTGFSSLSSPPFPNKSKPLRLSKILIFLGLTSTSVHLGLISAVVLKICDFIFLHDDSYYNRSIESTNR